MVYCPPVEYGSAGTIGAAKLGVPAKTGETLVTVGLRAGPASSASR